MFSSFMNVACLTDFGLFGEPATCGYSKKKSLPTGYATQV